MNYRAQNVEIWRRTVECQDLTFLRATRDATSYVRTDVNAPCLKI